MDLQQFAVQRSTENTLTLHSAPPITGTGGHIRGNTVRWLKLSIQHHCVLQALGYWAQQRPL